VDGGLTCATILLEHWEGGGEREKPALFQHKLGTGRGRVWEVRVEWKSLAQASAEHKSQGMC